MKIWIIWKWWAWKTTLSIFLIKELSKHKKVIAIDADSNKNLIDYLWFEEWDNLELWDLKKEIFEKAQVEASEYDRKYCPKWWKRVFSTDTTNDEILKRVVYKNWNISLIQLWEPREARVWVTWMCPYNETLKVYLSNLEEKEDEIVFVDFAAWSEAAWKWLVSSLDNIIIPLEPNSKNLDVAKDIYKTLKKINFKNVYFIINKLRQESDIDYIKEYFGEDINIIWFINFSKEIMKLDIRRDLDINKIDEENRNNIKKISDKVLNFKKDSEVLKRLQYLDELKWDKKCH